MVECIRVKTCTSCGRILPIAPAFFQSRADGLDGFRADCLDCTRQRNAAHYESNRPAICRQQAQWRADHEASIKEWNREWRQANAQHLAEYRLCNRARRAVYNRENAEEIRERQREYNLSTRGRLARSIANHNRRIRMLSGGGRYTIEDAQQQFANQRGLCWWCSKSLQDGFHIDHYVPLAKGGSNGRENIVISCPTCNKKKGTKLPFEIGRLL